jgi:hypothetical protein
VEELSYETVRILSTGTFCNRGKRMKHDSWPKAATFYSDYSDLVIGGEGEMIILNNQEQEDGAMLEEGTYDHWVMVKTSKL